MIQSLWNPFRDWNIDRQKYPQSTDRIQSLWNPFRDWNRLRRRCTHTIAIGFKASETLLGIETCDAPMYLEVVPARFKASETLLGIETDFQLELGDVTNDSKPLKPF